MRIKMKTILIILSSVIVTIMSIRRLIVASSTFEIVFGSVVAIIFGLFSLYLIFEKQFKSKNSYFIFVNFCNENRFIAQRIPFILALLLIEVLFFFYTPGNSIINGIRVSLMFLFLLGIILISLQIYKFRK